MFNVHKCAGSLQIYIYYDEYIGKDEDESLYTLEHMFLEGCAEEMDGTIDLITVKRLTKDEVIRIKEIHDLLKKGRIKSLNVISDNKKILSFIKNIMPDVSVELLKV